MPKSYKISIKQACKLCSISQSAYYYQPLKRPEDEVIKVRLNELAQQHPRWGFDKMMSYLTQKNCGWNHKRVHRIYCENGLNIRIKPRKRLPCGEAKPLFQPIRANVCWSIDFMTDTLSNGQKFRTLNVIDDYNREALLITPSFSLPSRRVTQLLDHVADMRGYPDMIRCDNGPEYASNEFKTWARDRGVLIDFIQPGKPAQNGFIERFNRTYREDILDMYLFDSINEVHKLTKRWIESYNEDRPHESLGDVAPNDFARAREASISIGRHQAAMLQQQKLDESAF